MPVKAFRPITEILLRQDLSSLPCVKGKVDTMFPITLLASSEAVTEVGCVAPERIRAVSRGWSASEVLLMYQNLELSAINRGELKLRLIASVAMVILQS